MPEGYENRHSRQPTFAPARGPHRGIMRRVGVIADSGVRHDTQGGAMLQRRRNQRQHSVSHLISCDFTAEPKWQSVASSGDDYRPIERNRAAFTGSTGPRFRLGIHEPVEQMTFKTTPDPRFPLFSPIRIGPRRLRGQVPVTDSPEGTGTFRLVPQFENRPLLLAARSPDPAAEPIAYTQGAPVP